MQANVKKILLVLILLACIAISVFMFIDEEYVIAAFCILFAVIMAILLHRVIKLNSTPESLFKGTISDILKTYDAILVEVENLPDISDKKLIQTISFKDMVNAEYEFRKPIYYIHNEYAYDFILFNKDDAYVYTVKVGNDKMSIVEKYLAEKNNSSSDLDMLDSLENTTVIKLNEDKEYLVSPVRKDDTNTNTNDNTSNIQAQEPMVQDNIVPEVNNEIQSSPVVEETTINTDSTSNISDTTIQEPVQESIVQNNVVPEVNTGIQSSPVVEESIVNTDSTTNMSNTTIQEPVQDSIVPEVNNETTVSSVNDNVNNGV